jgi:hypothetical protein
MTVEPAFWSRETAWVYPRSQRLGLHQNHCLTGPALVSANSACYRGGGGDHPRVNPSLLL